MELFKIIDKTNKLEKIGSRKFLLEKDLQELTEKNLWEVLGLDFLCTEFAIGDRRIDTLAFDKETDAFVIIEYKNRKSPKLLDQGLTYLSLMLDNREEFVHEYNRVKKTRKRISQIGWSQSKVILVSPEFTPLQKGAINFNDFPVEMLEVKKYENNFVGYKRLKRPATKASIKELVGKGLKSEKFGERRKSGKGAEMAVKEESIERVIREIKVYTEEDHFKKDGKEMVDLYEKLKVGVLNLDEDIRVKCHRNYIAFATNINIVRVKIQKSQLKMYINMPKGKLKDSMGVAENASGVGYESEGYLMNIKSDKNLEYILSLIKQSLEYEGKRRIRKG